MRRDDASIGDRTRKSNADFAETTIRARISRKTLAPRSNGGDDVTMRQQNSVSTLTPFTTLLIVALSLCAEVSASVTLDSLFRDHAVLQRDRAIPVSGRATAGEAITVRFGELTVAGNAGKDGRFVISLPPMEASLKARELSVRGSSGEARVKDVLVGEVWFCSGQSNMEWSVNQSDDADIAKSLAAKVPIRWFKAPHVTANRPAETEQGAWSVATKESVSDFTAIGFWFGVDLARSFDLEVPIGLVDISWGGTRIEPWIPLDLMAKSSFADIANELAARIAQPAVDPAVIAAERAQFDADIAAYWPTLMTLDIGGKEHWENKVVSSSAAPGWSTTTLPAYFPAFDSTLANFDGAVWCTRTFDITAEQANAPATLELGSIDDSDCAWIDGVVVGSTIAQPGQARAYALSKGLSAGTHHITICVMDTGGQGGFGSGADSMAISFLAKLANTVPQRVALGGEWHWRMGNTAPRLPVPVMRDFNRVPGTDAGEPAAIYNAMMAPCISFPVRGTLWYQGESNAGEHGKYELLLPLLISSWREKSGNPNMAWGVVQLAGFMPVSESEPAQGGWALLRRAQERGVIAAGNAGLASAIDLGDASDIHPRRKREVADRLAAWARNTVYGESTVEWQGPQLVKTRRDGTKVICEFANATGLHAVSGELGGFALAGADGKFVWASATINGNAVTLEATGVTNATEVVYAWQNNPERANLVNGALLPAIPFRETISAVGK